ncbi:MAG TPA: hypothetical protein VHK27_07115 [Gammaproteobacteria bacterium]|nr:hypothetical protein [Gammaproteobacteria bacterium]
MTQIDSNVPPPSTEKKVAARARKKRVAAKTNGAADLMKSLQFVMAAQKPVGTPYQTHCIINNHWCVAFDELLTIGCKVQEDIVACPHTTSFASALAKCGETLAITQLNESAISIKSDRFKATIKCARFEDMPISAPDPPAIEANDEIKKAFALLAWPLLDSSTTAAWKGAIYLQSNTAVACNGMVLLEYWHGLPLPAGVLIPKTSAIAIAKCDKKLVALGGSESSVTFYFEDESFIKTQLLKDNYPNYGVIFDQIPEDLTLLPNDFFAAVEAVKDFTESGFIYLRGDRLQSHRDDGLGASYEINGVPNGFSFNPEFLKSAQPHFFNTVFFDNRVKFSNDRIRGVIMGSNDT